MGFNKLHVLGLIVLVIFLLSMGFFCSIADSSLFICHSTCCTILLLLYVDDILLTGNNFFYLLQFIILLGREFSMKDLGPFHYFLGVKVQYFDGGLFLNQTKYATELLHRAQDLGPVHYFLGVGALDT